MELNNSIPAESPTTKEQQELQAQVVQNENERGNDLQQNRQEEKVFAQIAYSKEMDEKQTKSLRSSYQHQ